MLFVSETKTTRKKDMKDIMATEKNGGNQLDRIYYDKCRSSSNDLRRKNLNTHTEKDRPTN